MGVHGISGRAGRVSSTIAADTVVVWFLSLSSTKSRASRFREKSLSRYVFFSFALLFYLYPYYMRVFILLFMLGYDNFFSDFLRKELIVQSISTFEDFELKIATLASLIQY